MEPREQTHRQDAAAAADRFWHFATSRYASPAVARACLHAQDALAMDVNLILYAAWRAGEGEALGTAALDAAAARCRGWREAVVLPLRALRRDWKSASPGELEYAAVKQLELQAERAQMELLATLATDAGRAAVDAERGRPGRVDPLLADNLRTLCRHYGADEDALADVQAALALA